jgi:hypothetical protein
MDPITPLCPDCLARCHAGGEPDFPHRVATAGEACGAADCEAEDFDDAGEDFEADGRFEGIPRNWMGEPC